ncbi:MAG: hypothetical protein AAB759_03450 [Patescibacteria group bacterium]
MRDDYQQIVTALEDVTGLAEEADQGKERDDAGNCGYKRQMEIRLLSKP